jgi:hypothetical protein
VARHGLIAAYAESIQTVFVIAAPIGFIAFLAAWMIPHRELRRAVGSGPDTTTQSPAPPQVSEQEELAPSRATRATPPKLA